MFLLQPTKPKTQPIQNGINAKWIVGIVITVVTLLIIIVAALYFEKSDDTERIELENFEARMEQGERLKDWEKNRFTQLLWKVKGIRLFTCKSNYITKIGSLTGYEINENDLDWRGTGRNLDEALKEAFSRTGIPMEEFQVSSWEVDQYGKTRPVVWIALGKGEVNIDAPHIRSGPDVFHVGYKVFDKINSGKKKVGHIFLDCLPYFREVK